MSKENVEKNIAKVRCGIKITKTNSPVKQIIEK